ncbi:hypothetical protein [Marinimicrobium sp. ABcell2]|uniref:hypothetical protein n=1 Tax=Marinimicrobium sp. ABcell2 TaxID=3069751 RepID=UPI0027AFC88A|nr:hypothetical protein [Marinimicrobium sp. ABcell2]MDQ2075872.1 hypothetical protein [Marinimicrobium sp. ABcell2]
MAKIFLLVYFLFIGATAAANDLAGVWELVSGEYIDGEGELLDYEALELQSLKMISNSHFSFTSMKGNEFWASGTGTYEIVNGKYIETLQYNSFDEAPGTTFTFDTKVEDEYWYNSRWEGDVRVEYEVWRRLE